MNGDIIVVESSLNHGGERRNQKGARRGGYPLSWEMFRGMEGESSVERAGVVLPHISKDIKVVR